MVLKMEDLKQQARLKANYSRRKLGYSLFTPVDIWEILRSEGVAIIKKPLKSKISAFFMRRPPVALVLINSARTLGHQNFSAAHEYFHFLYDPGLLSRACETMKFDTKNAKEREADYFAAYFLAPDEAIAWYIQLRLGLKADLEINEIIGMEQFFQLSHQAMLNRLIDLGYLSTQKWEDYSKFKISALAKQLGYSNSLYTPTNDTVMLSDLPEKAILALNRGLISRGLYEEILLESGYPDLVFGEEWMSEANQQ